MLKCSGFIDLSVYYERYLTTLDEEQSENDVEEQFKDLIQSQEHDLDEDDVKVPVDQIGNEIDVLVADAIDEQDL